MLRFILALLITTPAMADTMGSLEFKEMLQSVEADFNGDGINDGAMLMALDETYGRVVLFTGKSSGGTDHKLVAAEEIWIPEMQGGPDLSVNAAGSLVVMSQNAGIGRNRWEQRITYAWREEAFRAVGFDYSWYDTLDLDAGGSCSLNLRTGRGIVEQNSGKRKLSFQAASVPAADWTSDAAIEMCLPSE